MSARRDHRRMAQVRVPAASPRTAPRDPVATSATTRHATDTSPRAYLDEDGSRITAAAPSGTTGRSAAMLVESERVLASVCEAVIGAAYLAFGFERTAAAVVESFADEIDEALEHPVDYKSLLQERLARRAEVVAYRTVSEEGPAHDKRFIAVAEVAGEELGRGEGKTKKSAEQEAALQALDAIEVEAAR